MQKKELRKLRALPATAEMMLKSRKETTKQTMNWQSAKMESKLIPQYDLMVRAQNLSSFIKIAIFIVKDMRNNIKTPRYEIFLNIKGNEYITRELDKSGNEVRWLSSMVQNLDKVDLWFNCPSIYYTADTYKTLNKLKLKSEDKTKGLQRLRAWQQEQKDKQTLLAEKRQQAPWDADMKLISKVIPKPFINWMARDVCNEFYIFYEYSRTGANKGFCSRCKKTVNINNPKHGQQTVCPSCKCKAEFKSSGKIKTLNTSTYHAQIIQNIEGGIVIRSFYQTQSYRGRNYEDPGVFTHEYKRELMFNDGSIRRYSYESYKNKYVRWCKTETPSYFYNTHKIKLFKKNLKNIVQIKHSALTLWDKLPVDVERYLKLERDMPVIEMLAKIGMFRLAEEIIHDEHEDTEALIDIHPTEISKMLHIDKSRLNRLREMNGGVYSLEWLQFEKQEDTIWPDEMIKEFGDAEITVTDLFNIEQISVLKQFNYLKKQSKLMDENIYQTLITWQDYINMAEKAKMDTSQDLIRKPKNLKAAHDHLIILNRQDGIKKEADKLKKKWPKVEKQLQKLQKFQFSDKKYCIVVPEQIKDIVEEGMVLGHCVHTCDYYFSRIQEDESYLFFLRKAISPDMPWYTLEVEPSGNIRQKRTTGDKQNADFDDAVKFLKKWQKYFKKQLSQEEIELGKKADRLRLEGYKKLREDGNRVWHGPLAGQLLADVLEKDFMEAM